jgi:hypothetical protein
MTEGLNDLERAALDALLAGDHPVLASLREQLDDCRFKRREFSGVGFFTHVDVDRTRHAPASSRARIVLSDVHASVTGLASGVGFLLFVTDGYLDNLEACTFDEPWPAAKILGWKLSYLQPAGGGNYQGIGSARDIDYLSRFDLRDR